jgi:DNA-binding transcriptional MocR family regulator
VNVPEQFSITGHSAESIAASVEAAIRAGAPAPGDSLPTVRDLAERIGVSPATVASAYRRLRERGLVVGAGRRGTRVSHRPPLPLRVLDEVPPGVRNLADGNPDPRLLPDLRAALDKFVAGPAMYGDRVNLPDLLGIFRDAFADDGIDPSYLAVVAGALDGIEKVLALEFRPGDRIAVEDPGFPRVLDLLGALGLVPEPVAVDDRGPEPEGLSRALRRGARCFFLTPRAHNPTGAVVDPERAEELAVRLRAHPEVLLIEDDHAGVAAGAPCTILSSGRARWVTVRTVSKALGPDLRLAVMAGDQTTIARVEGRQLLGMGWVSHVLQGIVVGLWKDPATPALLRRAEQTYARRRDALVAALSERGMAVAARSGLNVWVPVLDERAVAAALLKEGWAVARGEPFRVRAGPGIRVTTATLEPHEAEDLASALLRSANPRYVRTYTA